MTHREHYADRLADFAWQSWTELGVPGWSDQPTEWVIDPEALILLTASLGPGYPRLWLNALDWSVDHVNEVAVDRVRNLHKTWPELRHWTEFSGILAGHTKDKWPSSGPPNPLELPHTSRLELGRPGALALQLRKGLGVSAHAEVIRVFLTYPEGTRLTVLEVAEEIAYTKRTAANVVGRLRHALQSHTYGRAITYGKFDSEHAERQLGHWQVGGWRHEGSRRAEAPHVPEIPKGLYANGGFG